MPAVPRPGRLALVAAGVVGALLLPFAVYAVLRQSSAFAVRTVDVRGGDRAIQTSVRAAVMHAVGSRSLLAVSSAGVVRAVEQIPQVRAAWVDRDFPSTVKVRIVAERPAALAQAPDGFAVVSPTGRVLTEVVRGTKLPDLPRIPVARLPSLGQRLPDATALSALAAVTAIPSSFGGQVFRVAVDADGLVIVTLRSGLGIRLGPPTDLSAKLLAARLVLLAYPRSQRATLRYIDVSAPDRPVVCRAGGDPATASSGSPALDPYAGSCLPPPGAASTTSSGSSGTATATSSGTSSTSSSTTAKSASSTTSTTSPSSMTATATTTTTSTTP
jgi:cell division septal protein FtsQ